MTLDIASLFAPATPPEWLAQMLSNASTLKLKTSAWQSGGVTRTIMSIVSYALNLVDSNASGFSQAGFLQGAASGTISYWSPNADGTATITTKPITPDPSDPAVNPTGKPGWLDVVGANVYDEERIFAGPAGGPMALTNTSGSTYGTFAAGTYHVSNQYNKATYSNLAPLTIPPSPIAGTSITNVDNSAGTIRITTSTAHGLNTGDAVTIAGVTGTTPLTTSVPTSWYITRLDATHFTLQASNFSGTYSGGGTVRKPTVASFQSDLAGSSTTSTDVNGLPDVHTIRQPVTSLVGVTVDNLAVFYGADTESNPQYVDRCMLKLRALTRFGAKGVSVWAALSAVHLAALLSPPMVLSTPITRAARFVDPLTGIVHLYAANAAGVPSDEDLLVIQAVVDAFATPDATMVDVAKATDYPVTSIVNVYLPGAYATTATKTLIQQAQIDYVKSLPIGGVTDPGFATNIIPYEGWMKSITDACKAANVPLQDIDLSLNGAHLDLQLALNASEADVAVLAVSPPAVTLHAV